MQDYPRAGREEAMGFQTADVVDFARGLLRFSGVTTVWVDSTSDQDAALFVTVSGLDRFALRDRDRVFAAIEDFVAETRPDMDVSQFVFNYSVFVDDEEIGDPSIPRGARQIA